MRNKFFMACVAVIVFILMLCTIVGCNTTNESTNRLEKAIKEEEDSGDTTIINNYNDNSITTNNNITNSYYNTDTDEDEDDYEEEVVEEVYETEETVVDDKSDKEDYREYNNSDYNNTESNSSNNDDDTITPIGDLKNDMDPDPNVVHIKNIKCPNCGAYSYIEHYNLKDENLLFYMGTCNSCGYER